MSGLIEVSSPDVWFDKVTARQDNPGGMPSCFRLYLEKDMYGSEFNRWFANPTCVVLQPGPFSVTVPLTPDLWSSVYGKFGNYSADSLAGFKKVLSSPVAAGIVFGGGNFFGHGVAVRNGSAKLRMDNISFE
jgi:hypothetical protein